ncbi:MAG TPA: J domain-containing protein [Hyphomicrobiaceae bacterium]|jgi:hypothetical protein
MSARLTLIATAARLRAQAESESIAQAYRMLASEAHPDHGGSDSAMRELNAARERLSRPAKVEAPRSEPRTPVAPPRASAILPAENARTVWCTVAPAAATIEDALDPRFLGAKLGQMKPGDRIEIVHEKHGFLIEGLITGIDKDAGAVEYAPLRVLDLNGSATVRVDWEDATVAHEGPHHQWAVRIGGRIAKAGFATEALASEWLRLKQQIASAP